jgi:hypothetical protein
MATGIVKILPHPTLLVEGVDALLFVVQFVQDFAGVLSKIWVAGI